MHKATSTIVGCFLKEKKKIKMLRVKMLRENYFIMLRLLKLLEHYEINKSTALKKYFMSLYKKTLVRNACASVIHKPVHIPKCLLGLH